MASGPATAAPTAKTRGAPVAEVIQWIGWSILGLVALAIDGIIALDRYLSRHS